MSERGSFKVEYELRFPVHLPDGIFVYFASGLRDRDSGERVGEVLIRAKADQEGVAQQMAQLAAERIHVALGGVQADNCPRCHGRGVVSGMGETVRCPECVQADWRKPVEETDRRLVEGMLKHTRPVQADNKDSA